MRVFVAVDLPAPVRDAMVDAVAPVRAAWPSLGWVRTRAVAPDAHLLR